MSELTGSLADPKLVSVAKTINDLDELVQLILKRMTRTKPWQRQLAVRLGDVDRLVQVLRLTIALEKPNGEIAAAAASVAGACRRTAASMAGSRADYPSLQAVALVSNLGDKLQAGFSELA
ncbi:hypothetical protein ASC95_27515 [Pelomonas sp. Root1217]|uniref:hypothetical protein n=1 Tax=Pelomonas sp. Root1217 TaxID=1736430 RepID=UPI00070E5F10|nr:hypothetical protein [Pelomonas sp. Root1217]KQV45767.1 hypothetical protein ASC95_27515 [Pelomonas sp. Root1217]